MSYLEAAEYSAYGLEVDTADAWVAAASAMADAFCRRSSLLATAYTERLRVVQPWGRVQLTYGPVVQVTSVRARYGRRTDGGEGTLLHCALLFGLPGQWITLDPTTATLDTGTGELQLAANVLGLGYSDVEVSYTAGLATAPVPVKIAVAQIVKNAQTTPGLNVRSSKLDTLQTEYFSDVLLDAQVRAMLRPYVAERMG